jgi:hypothetical protein
MLQYVIVSDSPQWRRKSRSLVYRSSRQKFFNRNGSFTSSAPRDAPSPSGVATLVGASPRAGSKQWPPLASLGRESWPTTVVGVDELSGVRGFVTSVTSGTITIQGITGSSLEVSLTPSTVVTKVGRPAAPTDLTIGENVRVIFGSLDLGSATSIDIELSHVVGRVDAINGVTLTILGRDGVLRSVVVGSSTAFSKNGTIASLDDVAIGSYVIAEGSYNAPASTLAASVVDIGRPRSAGTKPGDEARQQSSFSTSTLRGVGHGSSTGAPRRQ